MGRMHPDEVWTDVALVARLLAAQFPRWVELPLAPVASAGTDNALYRLGEEMVVRLPRVPASAPQVDKEHRWLPRFAPRLPLAIPVPLARGEPGEGYPWRWSVYSWLEGETPDDGPIDGAAEDLAGFVGALWELDPAGGPRPGPENSGRGAPLATRDAWLREAIAALPPEDDAAAITAAWERALAAPEWDGPPVWLHGDLHRGNLLVAGGRLSGVVDFGCLGTGDPACDVMVAWNVLTAPQREAFRAALDVDDATWERARGWALSMWAGGIEYYLETNPGFVALARRGIDAVLAG